MSWKSSSAKSLSLALRLTVCAALALSTAGRAAGGASPDEPPTPAPVPPAPPPAPPAAGDSAPTSAAVIGEIRKEHNVDLAGNGRLALRLTVPATVLGMKDRPLALSVWFADERGQLVRSVLPEWADTNGNLRLSSRTATPPSDRVDYEFVLSVPYGAFPCRGGGPWRVEARAELHVLGGADAPGPAVPLATGTTSFFVE